MLLYLTKEITEKIWPPINDKQDLERLGLLVGM